MDVLGPYHKGDQSHNYNYKMVRCVASECFPKEKLLELGLDS